MLLAACSTTTVDDAPCTGDGCTAGGALSTGTLLDCSRTADTLRCTYTPPAADFPIRVDAMKIIAEDASVSLALDADAPTQASKVGVSRFLVSIDLSSKTVQLGLGRSLMAWMDLKAGESRSYALPFEVWNVRLQGVATLMNATLEKRSLPLAPFEAYPEYTTLDVALELPLKQGGRAIDLALLVAPGEKVLSGAGQFCQGGTCGAATAFEIAGPGTYDVKNGLLTKVVDQPIDGGSTDGDVADGGSADLAKSCGVEGKPRCLVGGNLVCDTGYVVTSLSEGLCHACGKEGQPRCLVGGNLVCDTGYVVTSLSEGLCHACGKEGQPRCLVDGNLVCDTGYVVTSLSEGLCHACGAAEQPACLVNGQWVCQAGLRRGYSDGLCHTN